VRSVADFVSSSTPRLDTPLKGQEVVLAGIEHILSQDLHADCVAIKRMVFLWCKHKHQSFAVDARISLLRKQLVTREPSARKCRDIGFRAPRYAPQMSVGTAHIPSDLPILH
jgi:hypothetical protein